MYILPEHCVAFPLQGVPGSYIYMQATRVLNQQNNSLHVALILAFVSCVNFSRNTYFHLMSIRYLHVLGHQGP